MNRHDEPRAFNRDRKMSAKSVRRRLVNRHIIVGEIAQQALAVAAADQEGIVDGVIVDFRHPSLPPGQWEARAWWHTALSTKDRNRCGFLFPSIAAKIDRGELREELEPGETIPYPRAKPGDKITVESVVDEISDRRFDHIHDAIVKNAFLVLTRPNGDQIRPESPLTFYGVTQFRDGPERDAYDRLAARILIENGGVDPHKYDAELKIEDTAEITLGEKALLAISDAERSWVKLVDVHLKDDPQGQAALRWALNAAVLAGFMQAKHELRAAEKTAAATMANLKKGSDALRNSQWHDFAGEMWKSQPNLSRSAVFKAMVAAEVAHPDEQRSILRSIKGHPLCPG